MGTPGPPPAVPGCGVPLLGCGIVNGLGSRQHHGVAASHTCASPCPRHAEDDAVAASGASVAAVPPAAFTSLARAGSRGWPWAAPTQGYPAGHPTPTFPFHLPCRDRVPTCLRPTAG